eukprot:407896-Lingulodinium_polyedra.AAC.1
MPGLRQHPCPRYVDIDAVQNTPRLMGTNAVRGGPQIAILCETSVENHKPVQARLGITIHVVRVAPRQ